MDDQIQQAQVTWFDTEFEAPDEDSDDQDPDPQEVYPISQTLEFHPAFEEEIDDNEVEDAWEVFNTDGGVQEVISIMEPVIEAITTEGAKKLFVMEDEARCEIDENLPDGWKTQTSNMNKQVQVSEMEEVVTASTSQTIPSVRSVFVREVGNVKDESSMMKIFLMAGKQKFGNLWKR
jgi:hypothetical protein